MQVQGDGPPRRGHIRWISKRKGFGFISPESGGDLFFHSSEVVGSFDELRPGDPVRFGIEPKRSGPVAIRVLKDTSPLTWGEGRVPPPRRRESPQSPPEHLFLLDQNGVFRYLPLTPGPAGKLLVESEELASIVTDAALLAASKGTARIFRICSQFEQIINDPNAHERIFQEFFEEYPDFLLADQYEALYPQVVLPIDAGRTLRPDFILRPFAGMTHEPEIVELKLPRQPIVKLNRSHVSLYNPIYEAVAQLRSYARVFADEDNREALADQLGFTAYRPSLALIVGRAANMPSQRLAALAREGIAPVQLHTYDDLLLRYRQRAGL